MSKFILKEVKNANIVNELEYIGFDSCYREKAQEKYKYKNLKIFSLNLPQANILKQIALTVGADCGIHREVITGKVESSDVLLGGSYSQLRKIAEKPAGGGCRQTRPSGENDGRWKTSVAHTG